MKRILLLVCTLSLVSCSGCNRNEVKKEKSKEVESRYKMKCEDVSDDGGGGNYRRCENKEAICYDGYGYSPFCFLKEINKEH